MLNDRDSLEALNLIGSICSIIALLFVLQDKFHVYNFIQIVLVVVFSICIGGLILKRIIGLYREYLVGYGNHYNIFTKVLYWLIASLVTISIVLIIGKFSYWLFAEIVCWLLALFK